MTRSRYLTSHIGGARKRVMAEHDIIILGQYSKTNKRLDVITGVSKKYPARVIEELEAVPQTIRFRVLY